MGDTIARGLAINVGKSVVGTASHLLDNAIHHKYIEGMEYLIAHHTRVRLSQSATVIDSGDSTTYGYSITDPNFLLHTLCKKFLNRFGVRSVTAINAGHNSMTTPYWRDGYLAADLAQNPTLYILRWGLNDAGDDPGYTNSLSLFTAALRQGLTALRAAKNVNQLSVILMMPNSTNDDTGHRNKPWFDAIYPVIKQAARDFQCCFIDTYNYLLDSTNVVWQDDLLANGIHIHPLETANAWIVSLMGEALIPTDLRKYGVTNLVTADDVRYGTDLPSTYEFGVSMARASGSGFGWPLDGMVQTIKGGDGVATQICSSLYAQVVESIAIRRGNTTGGISGSIGDNAWAPWFTVGASESTRALSLLNSWVNYGEPYDTAGYYRDSSGLVHFTGLIKSGLLPTFTSIGLLPVGYRPLKNKFLATTCDSAPATIGVLSSGSVQIMNCPTNGWLSLDGITPFRAEQ